jgi:uncharacterized membrane protein
MISLVAACIFFVGIHVVISGSPLRGVIVGRIGERPYLGLFSLLLLALLGPLLIDAKRRRAWGPKWQRFAEVTSNVPFAAILAGRNSLRLDEIGVWRPVVAVLVWVAMIAAHPWLFSVPALPSQEHGRPSSVGTVSI